MASSQSQNEPIAIVGSGCRFPGGASSPSKLWDLLSRPRDILTPIPPARFEARGFYHEDGEYSGHSNVLQSYLISEDHTAWDADFFNVAAGEASAVDPQQRLLVSFSVYLPSSFVHTTAHVGLYLFGRWSASMKHWRRAATASRNYVDRTRQYSLGWSVKNTAIYITVN